MSDTKQPKFLKDPSGFCYTWTALLAKHNKNLTPYDGDIDDAGMAVESKSKKAAAPKKVEAAPESPAAVAAAAVAPAAVVPVDADKE